MEHFLELCERELVQYKLSRAQQNWESFHLNQASLLRGGTKL